MRPTRVGSYLLLLRKGGVWGVNNESVLGVGRQEHEYHVQILSQRGAAQLIADDVLGVVEDLKVWPAAGVLRRFWSGSSRGLAVHAGAPILVVDPDRPPPTLMLEESLKESIAESSVEEGEDSSGEGEASDETVH